MRVLHLQEWLRSLPPPLTPPSHPPHMHIKKMRFDNKRNPQCYCLGPTMTMPARSHACRMTAAPHPPTHSPSRQHPPQPHNQMKRQTHNLVCGQQKKSHVPCLYTPPVRPERLLLSLSLSFALARSALHLSVVSTRRRRRPTRLMAFAATKR